MEVIIVVWNDLE